MKFFAFLMIVLSLWYGMRWIQQLEANRPKRGRRNNQQANARSRRQMKATDTIKCARCGAYVAADFPTACDRPDCPFPGVG